MKYIIILFIMCSCTAVHRLERRQYGANVEHILRETKTQQQREQTQEQPKFLEIRTDSGSFYLVPPKLVDSFMTMRITIDDVIVKSASRTLPERGGRVEIDFIVTLPKQLQGNCRNVIVTSYLHKPSAIVELEDLTIRGELFSRVQERNYWQYEQYRKLFSPDTITSSIAYDRFVKYPYAEGVRLDSVVENRNDISYHYTQEVEVDDDSKRLLITLGGRVLALDGSSYLLPKSDTLTYNISSMLNFVDTTTRYVQKIIEKYAVVNDRKYLSFKVNSTQIIDTLGDNSNQLRDIDRLLNELINQKEFHVDSIILTASASPEGDFQRNATLSRERALALKKYLGKELEGVITVRYIPEDWEGLKRLIVADGTIADKRAIVDVITNVSNPDKREDTLHIFSEYRYIKNSLYPKLRAVNFKYDLRRVGMIKDTIHTTEVDTLYRRGVELLKSRKYLQSSYILDSYKGINSAIVLISLNHNERAFELLNTPLPETAIICYLKAIVCSRIGLKRLGRENFLKACNLDENMEYRGALDPEIAELLRMD